MGKKAKKKAAGKKKQKNQKNQRNDPSFSMQVRKVFHEKGTELILALLTGIATNFITDATEWLLKRRERRKAAVLPPARTDTMATG